MSLLFTVLSTSSARRRIPPVVVPAGPASIRFEGEDTSEKELGFFAQIQLEDDSWETVGTVETPDEEGTGSLILTSIPDFPANSRYVTRLAAYNATGISSGASEIEIFTPPNVPVTGLSATSPAWDTVVLTFTEAPNPEDRPIAGGYEIQISRDGGTSFDEAWPELAGVGSGGITMVGISEGLEALAFRVRPVAQLDTGNYGDAYSGTAYVTTPEHVLNIDEWAETLGDAFVQGYAMTEPPTTLIAEDDLGLRPGDYNNSPTLGVEGPPGMPGETAMQITSGQTLNAGNNNLGCGLGQQDYTSTFSAIIAVKTTSTTLGRRILSASGSGSVGFGWQIRASSAVGSRPKLVFFNNLGTEIASVEAPSGTNMSDGNWHTVGMCYDAGRLSLWFDGVEMGATTIAEENFGDTFVYVRIRCGAQAHGSVGTSWFTGTLSRVKFFTVALSPAQWALAHNKYLNPVPTE